MRNRKALSEAKRNLRNPPPSPFPLTPPVPVGGFRLTIALSNPPRLVTNLRGLEGMPLYEFRSEPVELLLTVENATSAPLEYVISKGMERAYQLDVRGGRRFYQEGAEEKKNSVEKLFATQAPFTGYGASLYENSLFSILPLTPRFVPPVNYISMWFRSGGELLTDNPHVHRIRVDQLYDLSLGGFYRMTVRHVFPVQQPGPPPLPDDDAWIRYARAEHRNRIVPGACEVAVSNATDVFVTRSAMELVQ